MLIALAFYFINTTFKLDFYREIMSSGKSAEGYLDQKVTIDISD